MQDSSQLQQVARPAETPPLQVKVGRNIAAIYSVTFVVVVGALLASFLSVPGLSLSGLASNFRWRPELIQFFTALRWNMGDRLYNQSIRGSDGWLMYSGELSIQDYQNTEPLARSDLKRLQGQLDALDAYLHSQGRTLLVVIAPNKNTIYGRYLPSGIPVLGRKSRLDQFDAFMEAHGKTQVLDLRSALIAASKSEQVYYKTDTHWNDAGAYVAYVQILKALSASYPALQPHPRTDFKEVYGARVMGLPQIMGLPQLKERSMQLSPRFRVQGETSYIPLPDGRNVAFVTNQAPVLPSLLIYHDSFYDIGLRKFIEFSFSRVVAVPNTSTPGIWSTDWVRSQPSDIVVIEVTERYLNRLFVLMNTFK